MGQGNARGAEGARKKSRRQRTSAGQGPHASGEQRKGTSNAAVKAFGSRMLLPTVKMHKVGLQNERLIDRMGLQRAQNPLIQAIIMQFTIISRKSRLVKCFFKKITCFFALS